MAKLVVQGATLVCAMGSGPSNLSVASTNETYLGSSPAATVQDMKPETKRPRALDCDPVLRGLGG